MSDIEEILHEAGITHDDKARRVVNVSAGKVPNITLAELQAGVTIEKIESLNVPAFQYTTQITIHGVFPNAANDIRAMGYKSLTVNGNESLGVKYVAIDAGKKKILESCYYVSPMPHEGKDRRWAIVTDSTGTQAQKLFTDKETALEVYHSTPDDLYIGGKSIFRTLYGRFAVVITLGAIYERNLWKLCKALEGVESPSHLEELKAKAKEAQEIESKERAALWAQEAKELNAIKIVKAKELIAQLDAKYKRIEFSPREGKFIVLTDSYDEYRPRLIEIWRVKASGQLVYNAERYNITSETLPEVNKHKRKELPSKGWSHCWKIDEPKQAAPNKEIESVVETGSVTVTRDRSWVWIKYTSKPPESTLEKLRGMGARFSGKRAAWYLTSEPAPESLAEVTAA